MPRALDSVHVNQVVTDIAASGHSCSISERASTPQKICLAQEKVMRMFDRIDKTLDSKMPNSSLQTKMDELGHYIEGMFAPLREFNAFINSNGNGDLLSRLQFCLVKLPLRAARNIVALLYNVISSIVYGLVHPLKGLNHLAKYFVSLLYELTKPETWSKMGIGMVGASLGSLALGNPLVLVGMLVGAALTVAGLTVGMIKAAIQAEKGHVVDCLWRYLLSQGESLSESMLTGFFMGLMLGTVQRIQRRAQVKRYVNKLIENMEKPVENRWTSGRIFTAKEVTDVQIGKIDFAGKVTVKWREVIKRIYEYRDGNYASRSTYFLDPTSHTVTLVPDSKMIIGSYIGDEDWGRVGLWLPDFGMEPLSYTPSVLARSGHIVVGASQINHKK